MEIESVKPVRIAIAVPCQDEVKTEFAFSLAAMVNCIHGQQIPGLEALAVMNRRTSVLPDSRNALAEMALKQDFTHMLWIDSDMRFPPDMLQRLLARDVPFVGINASMRRPPYRTTAMLKDRELLVTNKHSTGLEKVERVGMGVVLHEVEVLRRIKKPPYFSFGYVKHKRIHRGEDYYFCEKVRRAGYQIYVDQDVSKDVGHIGEFVFYPVRDEVTEDG